jgi:hypothetical protein
LSRKILICRNFFLIHSIDKFLEEWYNKKAPYHWCHHNMKQSEGGNTMKIGKKRGAGCLV